MRFVLGSFVAVAARPDVEPPEFVTVNVSALAGSETDAKNATPRIVVIVFIASSTCPL
jgi:hypothetical protein